MFYLYKSNLTLLVLIYLRRTEAEPKRNRNGTERTFPIPNYSMMVILVFQILDYPDHQTNEQKSGDKICGYCHILPQKF